MPASPRSLWVDCDTGLDDALALLFAIGDPACALIGVSTVAGNCPLAAATANTLSVLQLAGAGRVPVHRGAAAPLCGRAEHAPQIHGEDGLGGLAGHMPPARTPVRPEPAALALCRALAARPGQIDVVATGPLTNLALALALDPAACAQARQLVVMGGAVAGPGNVGPVVEFNMGWDPEAAAAVLAGPWPVTLVGLDVTHQVRLTEAAATTLDGAGTAVASFCAAALRRYGAAYAEGGGRGSAPLHDPLAVAVAVDPGLVRAISVPLAVETRGALTRGMTVADLRVLQQPVLLAGRRCAQVCLEVEAAAAQARLLAAWSGQGRRRA